MSTVTDVLNTRVDDLSRRGCPCWEGVLIRFREAGKVMGACGHDTSALQPAIRAALGTTVVLLAVTNDILHA